MKTHAFNNNPGGGGNPGGGTGGGPIYADCNKNGCPPCITQTETITLGIFPVAGDMTLNTANVQSPPCDFAAVNSTVNQVIDNCFEDILPIFANLDRSAHSINITVSTPPDHICQYQETFFCTIQNLFNNPDVTVRSGCSGPFNGGPGFPASILMDFPIELPVGTPYIVEVRVVAACNNCPQNATMGEVSYEFTGDDNFPILGNPTVLQVDAREINNVFPCQI